MTLSNVEEVRVVRLPFEGLRAVSRVERSNHVSGVNTLSH